MPQDTAKARPMSGAKIAMIITGVIAAVGITTHFGVKSGVVNLGRLEGIKDRMLSFRQMCAPRLNMMQVFGEKPKMYKKAGSGTTSEHTRDLPELDKMVDSMSLEQWIGQMIQPEAGDTLCYQLHDVQSGGMFFGGSSNPGNDDAQSWKQRTHQVQKEALSVKPHNVPIFIGQDTIHGMSHVVGATHFPHNIGLGCTHNPELIKKVGEITAREATSVGVNWGFSPCVALATDIRWGRIYESFGQNEDLVGKMGAAYVEGANKVAAEGKPFITCGKHFVADGGVKFGTGRIRQIDRGDFKGSEEQLQQHLKPYRYLINAGVKSIMASYSSVNGHLNHGNKHLMQDVLKGEMGFKGFVSSDYAGIDGLDMDYGTAVAMSINAGIDQIMLATSAGHNASQLKKKPRPTPQFLKDTIKRKVNDKSIPWSRIRDAARRIMWAKYESGLMTYDHSKATNLAVVGHSDHKAVAREVVAQSVVPLKNDNNLLPLKLSQRKLCVAGEAAYNAGMQLGGWTLDWQSKKGSLQPHPVVSIFEGLQKNAKEQGAEHHVKLSIPGDCSDSDVALVVVGEEPYAEFLGDRETVPKPSDLELVQQIKKRHKIPVILLVIAGRPIDIEEASVHADAVAAAFLPGSEGGNGVADVLAGRKAPTGRLNMDWPRSGHSLVRVAAPHTFLYRYLDGLTWQVAPQ